jgi:1-acyl-sn-glycerol-3-phosphate acyltransferase
MTSIKRYPLYTILRPIATPLFKLAFRLEIEGRELVPSEGRVILASVHRSYLDIPMLGMVTRRQVHFMGKAELWERTFSRWFCESVGSFPVKRGEPDRAALTRSLEILADDEVLGLFPEGTRQEGPVVQHCHGGVAYLAQKTGAPVVPVAMTGTDKAMGLGSSFPKPKKIHVLVGQPIDLRQAGEKPASRAAREKATEHLRGELQRLYDTLRATTGE